MDLHGKVGVITGGKRLGLRIAEALVKRGANVVMTYLHSKKIIEYAISKFKKSGARAYAVKTDLSREKDVKKLFRFALKKFGRVDFLINMASTFNKTPFQKLNKKIWDMETGNNLTSAFLCAKEAGDIMLKQKSGGKIILFGDAQVEKPYTGRLPYLTSKGGLHVLGKILAIELSPKIKVNVIAPRYIHFGKNPPGAKTRKLHKKIIGPMAVEKKLLLLLKNDVTGKIFTL